MVIMAVASLATSSLVFTLKDGYSGYKEINTHNSAWTGQGDVDGRQCGGVAARRKLLVNCFPNEILQLPQMEHLRDVSTVHSVARPG